MKSLRKRMAIIPALMLLLLAGVTVMASCDSHRKEKEMALAAQQEQARRDSIDALNHAAYEEFAKDSTEKAQLSTRSLALFELRGPVKSVTFSKKPGIFPSAIENPPKTYTFDEQGNWTNYHNLYRNCHAKARGGVSTNGYVTDDEFFQTTGVAYEEIKWNNGEVRSVTNACDGGSDEYTFKFEKEYPQNLMSKFCFTDGAEGDRNASVIFEVTQRDSYGNWLERKASKVTSEDNFDEEGNEKYVRKDHWTESRTIEYWPIQAPTRIPY